MHFLEIVQWDSTRRDHPGNLGGVSGSGPVSSREVLVYRMIGHTCMNLCLARLCLFDTLDIDVCLDFAYL